MKTVQEKSFARKTAALLRAIGQPVRLRILLAIGQGEACVCHLEAVLGLRQAYISQHLMALRDSGLVSARRDGKYVFYRLQDPALLDLIAAAARVAGAGTPASAPAGSHAECGCPSCSPQEVDSLMQVGGQGA